MSRLIQAMLATGLVLLVAGCAQLSPQQVSFDPTLNVDAVPKGSGTTVWVDVEDRRQNNEIGRRGGTYPESSVITPKGNLREKLRQITEEVIDRAGYQRVEMNPEVEITVSLDELIYELEEIDATRKSAMATAKVSIKLVRDMASYSNSFRTQRTIETFRYPSEEQNEELLNKVFESALQRMFSDPGLADFLNQR